MLLYRRKALFFIIPPHCSSNTGLAGGGSLAVVTENHVAVGHIYKMVYRKWMLEEITTVPNTYRIAGRKEYLS